MKLEALEIFFIETPPPGWGGRYWTIVKLVTECGITGYGEVYASAVGAPAMGAVIRDVFDRYCKGENPESIERMFRRAYSSGFTQRPDPTVIGAFSGLEIACWDILGKARDRPVWALLGGMMNEKLRAYTYLYPLPHHTKAEFWTSPELTAESALAAVNQGFTAIKLDPAGPYTMRGGHQPGMRDIDLCDRMLGAVRAAIGTRADILLGTHGQFTPSGAIRLGAAMERHQPLWFEEPTPPDDIAGMAEVASAVRIPIATGERLSTKAEFGAVLRAGAASILQPALGRAGGIWEVKKIAAMAEVFGAQLAPHLYAGPVEWAANIHLAASIPNLLMIECIQTGGEFHLPLIGHSLRVEDGFVTPPETPGLGISFDEDLARAHPFTGNALHLQMQEAPCDYVNPNSFEGGAPRD
ncbi:mandelate racemase/muconate lactonizing enzyme family protein [Roseinatronobacter monicus]|uniref:mandelate racemase/muconate lactonizing enzyme family protein n=1 Tax=Roseinatronobacter monicus TaxID=393481 RepID=UPI003F3E0DD3